jgi:nicotinate-nucleotide pyrophosphorylase (carboxylating)
MKMKLEAPDYAALIALALAEDIGSGDLTSRALIPEERAGRARVMAKEPLVICGQEIARAVFSAVDPALQYQPLMPDGEFVSAQTAIGEVTGPLRPMLTAERTVLNFLQRLSGIATTAHRVVHLVRPYPAQILDTRKTTPGWRRLEKYAVCAGGGTNHRQGLSDAVLIKNNHIDAMGGNAGGAVEKCRKAVPASVQITVEVRNPEELRQAVQAKPDVILLDNMTPEGVRASVEYIRARSAGGQILSEASGGINEANVREYAAAGVDRISMGMLTHSARAADISLSYCG